MTDMPELACDSHMHVFGDPSRYKPAARRAYTPTEATLAQWRAMAHPLGVRRVVLVQPSAYGTDNACMLDGLRAAMPVAGQGEARGVAVIDDATPEAALHEMHALGVRGVRLNLVSSGAPDAAGAASLLRATAARVAPLGWHVQVFADGALVAALADLIATLGVPVVLDHMAGARAALGLGQPGLQAALRLLRAGVWVKLSGADRVAATREAFAEALPIMRAMLEANPDRLVWGTDWPHIGPHGNLADPQTVVYLQLDQAALLAGLRQAAGAAFSRILADNPARLYGWA
jgi:predicted TIM-barrel fold metal-dependent hydrolase